MTKLRQERIDGIAKSCPKTEVDDPSGEAKICVVGWGSTYGALNAGVERVRARGLEAAHVHLTHLNPLPSDLGEVLKGYDKVLVPEMNLGQLVKMIRSEYLVDAQPLSKMRGVPFKAAEIESAILEQLGAN
jgi:2-oxoglutarate ferredoxin oxidoreductase subunit alpha